MRTTFIWICRAIVIGLALVVVAVIAVNAYDPPLRPEVRRLLEEPVRATDNARRAFFFVLGVSVGEKEDPEAKGAALWETGLTADVRARLAAAHPWATHDFERCRPDDACTVESLARDPNLVTALTKNPDVVRAYTKLMEYGEGTTLTIEGEAPVSGLPADGHQLFLLQLAQWQRQGGGERVLDLLASSNGFMQSFMRSGSFFDRLVAAVDLRANHRFVTALARAGVRVPEEIVRGLEATPPLAQITEGAAQTELRFAYAQLRAPVRAEGEPLNHYLARRLLTRPNETTNLYYEALQQLMASDCPDEMDVRTCLPMLNFPRWASFINPEGKRVVTQTATLLHGYRAKLRGILREVRGD